MKTVVHDLYGVQLAVINIGDIFTTGPEEAAAAITSFIRPVSVIPSHANEVATTGGGVIGGTRTERFINLVAPNFGRQNGRRNISVFVPLSGVTMEFDRQGRCQTGCHGQ